MFESVHIKLGKFLKSKRIARGATQKEISEHLGYSSPQFISNCERGLCSPPLDSLREMLKYYEVDPREVMNIILQEQEAYLKQHLNYKSRRHKSS